tara:strand:+ start:2376 stop:3983 length:1608 start_codon:yes stop_codon:yes gene_type:complete
MKKILFNLSQTKIIYKNIGTNIFISYVFFNLLSGLIEIYTLIYAFLYFSNLAGEENVNKFLFIQGILFGENFNLTNLIILLFLTTLVRLINLKFGIILSYKAGKKFSYDIYKIKYDKYLELNSKKNTTIDEIQTLTTRKSDELVANIIIPFIHFISNGINFLFISIFIFFIIDITIFNLILLISISYLSLFLISSNTFKKNAGIITNNLIIINSLVNTKFRNLINYSLSKNKIDLNYLFLNKNNDLRDAQAKNMFMTQSPRYFIEILLYLIVFTYIYLFKDNVFKDSEDIAKFSSLALTAIRGVPFFQRIYWSLTTYYSRQKILKEYYELSELDLNEKNIKNGKKLHKSKYISSLLNRLNDEGYKFTSRKLNIRKTALIKISGKSGSGKSTLIRKLIGLGSSKKLLKNDSIFIDSNSIFYSNNIYENYLHIDKNAKNKKEFNKILDITEFPRDKFDNNTKFKNLSMGENQRYSLAINIFISQRSGLLFLDEALNGVNSLQTLRILKNLKEIWNGAIVIVHHDLKNDRVFDLNIKL